MEFEGEIEIAADKQRLWDAASDPEVLMTCVPGAREITQVSETKYTGVIERGVAGITLSLSGEAEMTELDPPDRLVAMASGEDSNTNSRMDAEVEMVLSKAGSGGSSLYYAVDLDFTGRLASLGSRIVKRKISSDISTFFDNLQAHVEAE